MAQKVSIHSGNLDYAKKSVLNWHVPSSVSKDVLDFITALGMGQVNAGNRLGTSTQLKYIHTLKCSLTYLNKPVTSLKLRDIEEFEKALSSDKIKSWKKRPYSISMKVDIRLALKSFLKWKLGPKKAQLLSGWFDLKTPKKTPEYLTESEILKLYKSCNNSEQRFLIAILFDSGARAEEFLNIRFEDIEMPSKNNNFIKITLKEEYSKTDGRVISLYWTKSLEAISDYLEERKRNYHKNEDPVFSLNYDASRMFLTRLGKKVLGKHIYFHLFRHSSATYYATKLNRQELCYRYGWKFSSNMPDVYISRSGMLNKDLDDKMTNTELSLLQSKVDHLEFQLKKILDRAIPTLKKVKSKYS